MRDLTYLVAISLDGFIAQTDGSHGGFSTDAAYWQALFQEFPETVPTHLREAMGITGENRHFDTVLMGRKTYEVGLIGHLRLMPRLRPRLPFEDPLHDAQWISDSPS